MSNNSANRRIATALAGPDFTPIEVLNIGLGNWFNDPFPSDSSELLIEAGVYAWIPPEYWSADNTRATEAATVPAGWMTAAARIVMHGGAADSLVRVGAFSDDMLAEYLGDMTAMLEARAPLFKVKAGESFADTFFVPPKHSLGVAVLIGGMASPSDGMKPVEVSYLRGV